VARKAEGESAELVIEPTPGMLETVRVDRVEAPDFSNGAAARLTAGSLPLRRDVAWLGRPQPRQLFVRAAGRGELQWQWGDQQGTLVLHGPGGDLRWYSTLLPPAPGTRVMELTGEVPEGTDEEILVDVALVAPAEWDAAPQNAVGIYPTALFHAGHTHLETQSVEFQPDRDPATTIFYGPNLPLSAGTYEVELVVDSPAAAGTELGHFRLRGGASSGTGITVKAGEPARFSFPHLEQDLFSVEFDYFGTQPVSLRRVNLIPIAENH
jgi:hypothetical protein